MNGDVNITSSESDVVLKHVIDSDRPLLLFEFERRLLIIITRFILFANRGTALKAVGSSVVQSNYTLNKLDNLRRTRIQWFC